METDDVKSLPILDAPVDGAEETETGESFNPNWSSDAPRGGRAGT